MADNTKKTSDSDPKSPGTRPFEVEELDDAALEGVSGGDTNNGCNFAAGCGVATNPKLSGSGGSN